MRARYYAPEIKRFLNVDPKKGSLLDSKTLNNYGYVSGNPIVNIDPEGMFIWWLAAAIVGAVVSVASTFVGDLIGMATGQQEGFSSLGTYAGSLVGGAVEGVVTVVAGPVAGGAAGGLVSNATQQGVDILTGVDEDGQFDPVDMAVDTGLGAAFGAIDIKSNIKIKGVSAGRNSWSSVYDSAISKRSKNMSLKTVGKGIGAGLVKDLPGTVIEDKYKDLAKQGIYRVVDAMRDTTNRGSTRPAMSYK